MLTYDYFRQERIRQFLADSSRTGRPKAIILDGSVFLYDLLVIGYATRTTASPDDVRKKHGKLRPLARTALIQPEDEPLRDFILGIAEVRNAAAHEAISDAELEARFVAVWKTVAGNASWPDSVVTRSRYVRATFSLIGFELGRWQVGLPPSGYFSGEQRVDWAALAK